MISFSAPYTPTTMKLGDVFKARQYPRQAFDDLADPVLNIDWFEMKGPTFPTHPHAGFSAVTYLFADSPNGFRNRDSLGEEHEIKPGGLHWSRASRGLLHEETPLPGGGAVCGLQIFVNLPAASQSAPAAAFPVPPQLVRHERGPGWSRRVAVDGTSIGGVAGALPSPVRLGEFEIEQDGSIAETVPAGWGGMMIVLAGKASIDGATAVETNQAIGFAANAESELRMEAQDEPTRLALVLGKRLGQPIHAHGPLMMATPDALLTAREYVGRLRIPELAPTA